MRELFDIARDIATSHEPDVDGMVKDLSTHELERVWFIVNGWYHDAKVARGIAESREIDLMVKVSRLNSLMFEMLGAKEERDG